MTPSSLSLLRALPRVTLAWIVALAALLPGAAALAQTQSNCTDVRVQAGDTLSTIATRALGNPLAYPQIVAATNARAAADGTYATIANPDALVIGWKLCVPVASLPAVAAPAAAAPATVAPATAQPAATATPASTPAAMLSVAPSATATPNQPPPINAEELTIEWLRVQETPGSTITVEEVLAPGSNYNRYLVSYLSEGLKIYAYMTIPQGTKPETGWPAIVFNHGYIPPTVYRSTERYIAYVDGFARNGYVVFRPDYRGHGFSEGEAGGAYASPDYVIDVLNALESVKNHLDVDPNRLGMWGHSMGGYITMRAMVARDDIKAGVVWAGVVGSYADLLENWRRNTNTTTPTPVPVTVGSRQRRWRTDLVERFGTPAENPAFWASISADSYFDEISGPVQFHHGTADSSVPVVLSRIVDAKLRAGGQVSEYFEYSGDDHNLSASLYTALERSVAFFDRYVKNAN